MANAQGIDVKDRGRAPAELMARSKEATGKREPERLPLVGQCHGLEAVRVIQACRGSAGMWLSVVTVCDLDARGALSARAWRAMAGEPGPGAYRFGVKWRGPCVA